MCFFSACIIKIIPLYLNILLGYIAGKLLHANRDTIVRIMFYMINPIVIFNGVLHIDLRPDTLAIPAVVFFISASLCFVFYKIAHGMWQDATATLVSYSAGSANTGYFGLPIALLLFDEHGEALYIMGLLGVSFYENTLGVSLFDKGGFSVKNTVKSFATLPAFYALIIGLMINYAQIPIPEIFDEFMRHIKGAYALLGMMIVGLGLATLSHFKLDFKFLGITFFAKFVVWPLVILSIIFIDRHLIGFFNQQIYDALVLLSIVPLSVNTVMMASLTNSYPEKAATAVLISTFFALGYIPIMANYFIL